MNREDTGSSVWKGQPSAVQELLLRASLLRGGASVNAWEMWISQADIDQLDGDSIRLLPLLYASLKSQGIDTPEMQRFKGVYRHTWYKNHLLVRDVAPVISALKQAGIDTLILKGAALIQGYYSDYGLRPMGDFDLLVPAPSAWQAMEMLHAQGWQLAYGKDIYREERITEDREQAFFSPTKQRLDLHWHALESFFDERGAEKTDSMFWSGSRITSFHGVSVLVPNPADLLLHVCVHGLEGCLQTSRLRWIADGFTLLNKPGLEMDWDRLLQQAREHHLSLLLRDALGYLSVVLDVPIPATVLSGLKSIPTARKHHVLYALWTLPSAMRPAFISPARPSESFQSHWRSYRRWYAAATKSKSNRSVFRYLQEVWYLESPAQVPQTIGRRVLKKLIATVAAVRNQQSLLKTPQWQHQRPLRRNQKGN